MSSSNLQTLFADEGNREPFLNDTTIERAKSVFADTMIAQWIRAARKLNKAGYGDRVAALYVRHSLAVAERIDPRVAIDLADTVSIVAIKAGPANAERLPVVAEEAACRLEEVQLFLSWMGLIARFAALAPESMGLLLDRMGRLLATLSVSGLEAWIFAGVRSSAGDKTRRKRFFAFEDPEAERWLLREAGQVTFADQENRLRYYLDALWGCRVPIREPPTHAPINARRRAGFGGGVVRLPTSFPGYNGIRAEDLYRAATAHIGAHLTFSRQRFDLGNLKPIQVALVSLIEDARVEQLAMREFPGLRRLWLRFHIAQATGALTAPSLLARLSRALIDPDFEDVDGFVRKGRDWFHDRARDWESTRISRELGNMLGNDLGQLRIQFNPRTYVVEPVYRDDNLGLWDFGDDPPDDGMEAEYVLDSVRFEEREDQSQPPDRERQEVDEVPDDAREQMKVQMIEMEGVPVARYPEYDHETGRERPDWTVLVEYPPRPGPLQVMEHFEKSRADEINRISNLIRAARVSRHQRVRRQNEGEYLDIGACIEASISLRIGETPDPRIHGRWERRNRDLSVLILLDISESTNDHVVGADVSVLMAERDATALLGHAMSDLGDPFAIAAFCSDTREDVRYFRIKDFDQPYDGLVKSYLAGMEGGLSTRMGAAIRHAGRSLDDQQTHRKLLLIISDGEPSDLDVSDPDYLVEDARKAVQTLSQRGIDVFCVGLDSGGDSYLNRIFGRRNVVRIDRVEALPEKLPMLYLRLTS